MRSYNESTKSKKTVASMIERKGDEKQAPPPKKTVKIVEEQPEEKVQETPSPNGDLSDEIISGNRRKLAEKLSGKKKTADSK